MKDALFQSGDEESRNGDMNIDSQKLQDQLNRFLTHPYGTNIGGNVLRGI